MAAERSNNPFISRKRNINMILESDEEEQQQTLSNQPPDTVTIVDDDDDEDDDAAAAAATDSRKFHPSATPKKLMPFRKRIHSAVTTTPIGIDAEASTSRAKPKNTTNTGYIDSKPSTSSTKQKITLHQLKTALRAQGKIRDLVFSDDEEIIGGQSQEFLSVPEPTPPTPTPNRNQLQIRRRPSPITINLAAPENEGTAEIPFISVFLGKQLFIETNNYRNINYLCFFRKENGETRNRFNIPVEQLPILKKALDAIEEKIKS